MSKDNKLEFRASELVINTRGGVEYLNIRSAGNPALIEEARSLGVQDYEAEEEAETADDLDED